MGGVGCPCNAVKKQAMTTAVLLDDIRLLVDRALSGDQHAMLEIFDRYRQRVFGLCYRMLGQREDAEDASQEAFHRVLGNLATWDQQRAFEPWLLTIAANRCRTKLARRKRETFPQLLPFAPADHRWTQATEAEHLREEMQLALRALPENHRRAFCLFHQSQCSYAEISSKLDVPEGTVKTWVHRARRELVQKLVARQVVEQHHAV